LALAAPLALVAVGVVLLFVPWSSTSTCTAIPGGPQSCTTKSETLLEAGIPPEGWVLVAMLLAAFLLVPVLAYGDVRLRLSWSRVLLRVVAVVLVLFAFVTGFSIGVFILPSALLAAASAALSAGGGRAGRLTASFD
jgi:hypothetical protein